MKLAAGTRIGPYEIVLLLGRGGMGEHAALARGIVEDSQITRLRDW